MNYKRYIAEKIDSEFVSESDIVLAQVGGADYALPCFKYAKILRKSPVMVAQEFAEKLVGDKIIERAEVLNGYLNFYIDKLSRIESTIAQIGGSEELSKLRADNSGKNICIDFSSINIAKPFHIGHLMSTAIGASLYRIFKYMGYTPIGINHLGDWGTQFGKLICAYKMWGSKEKLEEGGLDELLSLYVRYTAESEKDNALIEAGRREFLLIEQGDSEAVQLFTWFKEITLGEVGKVYDELGITFDSYNGESFYNDKMEPIVDELEQKGLLVSSDGAMIVQLEDYNMPPCLIKRSDGATLYATRDLAAAVYRKNTYNFYKSLYVVATQQNLHFAQVFKVLELMGKDWSKDCEHIKFGMVSYNGQALSTRQGHIVFLKDVISTCIEKASGIISAKNPNLENKEEIAKKIGIGAVMFFALSTNRIKDVDFNYEKVLSFEGETAPYLQYTYARCRSLINKAQNVSDDIDKSVLIDDESMAVIIKLSEFDNAVIDSAEKYEPSIIAKYLLDLAQCYNRFYLKNRVVTEDAVTTSARVKLTSMVASVISEGLKLLLIAAPESM